MIILLQQSCSNYQADPDGARSNPCETVLFMELALVNVYVLFTGIVMGTR